MVRRLTLDDAPDLCEVLGDDEVMRFIEAPFDLAATRAFIAQAGLSDPPRVYALEEKSSSRVVGHVVFHPLERADVYEIGWIIGRSSWHRGYATEIGRGLIRHGFETMRLHKIVGETVDPVKSLALMQKLGMRLEGIHRRQARLRDEWLDVYWCGILATDEA